MKLHGVIELHVPGERVLRQPGIWDRVRKAFGGDPDLRTDRTRAALEATAVVDAARAALARMGATNAISLVIDDQVLFQDRDARPDDLGDLFLAFSEHQSVFGGGFRLLRLAAEHQEGGLHLVVEVVARGEHPMNEPAARVIVAGRIRAFEPRPGEDADAYRARVEPLAGDAATVTVAQRQFESFVSRLAEALRAAMPEARVELAAAEARVQRPSRRAAEPAPPTSPNYDPYGHWYGSPLDTVLSMMMWSSIFHMAMGPSVVVVDHHDHPVGTTETVSADADDHSGDAGGGDAGDGSGDAGDGGDGDAGGDIGGDTDGFGGDFDGGDFGGDFGGFD